MNDSGSEMTGSAAIELEIFKHLFASIAEEMGTRLMRSAFSPNIKERRDFSCAVFDGRGGMIAQAAHIPVHLGSTPMSVAAVLDAFDPREMSADDRFILNDPFAGGTHLPDVTMVAPCLVDAKRGPLFFVANRAHHSDVGGAAAGSLPLSRHIDEEGVRLGPTKVTEAVLADFADQSRTPDERRGDLQAQLAALEVGIQRLVEMTHRYSDAEVATRAERLQTYSDRLMRHVITQIPDGDYVFEDLLDDDGVGNEDIRIHARVLIRGERATVDFSESDDQSQGPLNAVRAIAVSAVNYVFQCIAPEHLPSNAGVMRPIEVITRNGSIVDATYPSAVAAGNVETSQRIVDVLLGALAKTLPGRIPAASCGSMNNIMIGGKDARVESEGEAGRAFTYYETIAGGAGGSPAGDGGSAVHTHMTNTLNTPVEALEHAYPMTIERYAIREDSGGRGAAGSGGDGVVRCFRFDTDVELTLMTERRRRGPYGLHGGGAGAPGENVLIGAGGERQDLPAKCNLHLPAGAGVQIATPGGGGCDSP